jgi:hypothetical protein
MPLPSGPWQVIQVSFSNNRAASSAKTLAVGKDPASNKSAAVIRRNVFMIYPVFNTIKKAR